MRLSQEKDRVGKASTVKPQAVNPNTVTPNNHKTLNPKNHQTLNPKNRETLNPETHMVEGFGSQGSRKTENFRVPTLFPLSTGGFLSQGFALRVGSFIC